MSYPRRILVAWLLLIVLVPATRAADPPGMGIGNQMTNMFDTMLNHTAPTAHLGQRRGVLTGVVGRIGLHEALGQVVRGLRDREGQGQDEGHAARPFRKLLSSRVISSLSERLRPSSSLSWMLPAP